MEHRAFEPADRLDAYVITDDHVAIAMAPWSAGFPADRTSPEIDFERGRAWVTAIATAADLHHHDRPDLAAQAITEAERIGGRIDDPTRWASEDFVAGVNAQLALALRYARTASN